MAAQLQRDMVFGALTRPQMFAGVTYSYFVINAVCTAELFLITKSFLAFLAAGMLHLAGYLACLKEPRIFDLWLTRVSRCTRVKNWRVYYSQRGVPVASPLQGGSAFAALSLNLSALMLIMTTLGLLLTAKIVLSLLLALGPVFFIFLLFDATRGLFQGWLSAAIGFAFVPLLAALGLAVQLALLGPQLDVLGHVMARNAVDLAPPTSIFALSMIFAMVSAALTVAAAMIALGLRRSARQRDPAAATERAEKIYKSHTTDLDALRPVGSRAPDRASQIAGSAAAAMSRRELRTTEATLVSRTPAVARPGGTSADIAIQGRTNPGQRRSAQPRRSAANLRRDL